MKNNIIAYYQLNKEIKYVFFDCFETVIHRYMHTENLKMLWSDQLKKKLGMRISSELLYLIRRESEQIVSLSKGIILQEFTYKELIKQIYIKLNSIEENCISFADFYEITLKLEIDVERDNCYLDRETDEAIKYLVENKIPCYILSDFYLESGDLKKLLMQMGVNAVEKIYVSADFKKSKYTGELYPCICKELGIKENEALMIGDNKVSDYHNAKRNGWDAYYRKWEAYPSIVDKKFVEHQLLKIAKVKEKYPYTNYAFSLFLFIDELYEKLVYNNIKTVLFLSREGELLKKLFDCYCMDREFSDIKSIYFYTSRISSFVAGLREISEETFAGLFNRYTNMSIDIFLESLGFEEAWINAIQQKMKYDFNEIISEFSKSAAFASLKKNELFLYYYNMHRKNQQKLLLKYMTQLGLNESAKITLVDVGWRGTIQDNLAYFINDAFPISGYYIGISKLKNISSQNWKEGIIFSEYPVKSPNFEIWNFDKFMYERILLASHPTTIKYKEQEGRVIPVFKEYLNEEESYQYIRPYQEEIIRKFNALNMLFENTCYRAKTFSRFFTQIHLNMLCKIGKKEVQMQKQLYEYNHESFGEFSKMKTSFGGEVLRAIRTGKVPLKRIIRTGMNFTYINSISLTMIFITHGMGWMLPILYRLLYFGQKKKMYLE